MESIRSLTSAKWRIPKHSENTAVHRCRRSKHRPDRMLEFGMGEAVSASWRPRGAPAQGRRSVAPRMVTSISRVAHRSAHSEIRHNMASNIDAAQIAGKRGDGSDAGFSKANSRKPMSGKVEFQEWDTCGTFATGHTGRWKLGGMY